MLGGGNPVGGSNPAGVGTSINYIGNKCYAYSGKVPAGGASAADQTTLSFTTGNEFLDVSVNIYYTGVSSEAAFIDCFMNNINVMSTLSDSSGAGLALLDLPILFVIPPFTKFEIKVGDNASGKFFTVLLTGDVYA